MATLLLAGGQGSRLGFDGPKGKFVLGPGDDRSLYAIQAERVGAASRRAGRPVPLIVLVSEATEAATRAAFERGRAAWGLVEGQVRFLCQRRLPALDADGRALLEAPGRLAMAPDGHGGALGALVRSGLLDELAQRGVDVLTTYQVDNPLALPLDPVMLGWMVERHAQVIGKAVKRLPGREGGRVRAHGPGKPPHRGVQRVPRRRHAGVPHDGLHRAARLRRPVAQGALRRRLCAAVPPRLQEGAVPGRGRRRRPAGVARTPTSSSSSSST